MYSAATLVHHKHGNVTIECLNEEIFPLHVPALVFVAICMIVGTIGNLFVIIIYKTKFRHSNHRYFILFLACTDLIACITGMPFLIASLRLPFLMESVIVCKALRYLHYFVNNASGLLLVVISMERFRKICRPFKTQLTHQHTLKLCWGVVAFSAVMAAPSAVLYTASPIHTGIGNITGYQCYVNEQSSGFFLAYMILLFLETVVSIIIFAVIYTFVIRTLWKSDQFLSSMRSKSSESTRSEHSSSVDFDGVEFPSERDSGIESPREGSSDGKCVNIVNGTDNKNVTPTPISRSQTLGKSSTLNDGNLVSRSNRSLVQEATDNEQFNKQHTPAAANKVKRDQVKRANSDPTLNRIKTVDISPAERLAYTNVLNSAKKRSGRGGKHSKATARVTVMLLIVSLFFAIAFIPHLVLMFIAKLKYHFVDRLSKIDYVFFQIFLRIFIINNVVNPIIYLIFDTKFRMLSRQVFKRRCRK